MVPNNHQITRSPNHQIQWGFTLIELLVVLTLITTLSAIGMMPRSAGGNTTGSINVRTYPDSLSASDG